jgi:WhiB family redox-sensing transcriptional regulator
MSTLENQWADHTTIVWLMSPEDGDTTQWLKSLLQRPDWMLEGACRGHDPERFFPTRGTSTALAKAVCARCTVRGPCLEFALQDPSTPGIWGGTSERGRRKLRCDATTPEP